MGNGSAFVERFWDKVEKSDECWLWIGYIKPNGYGQFHLRTGDNRNTLAHRWAWILTYGNVPEGMQVCHHCDVRRCVRPDHLFLGTNLDNVIDMMQKLRHRYGETHHNAKITDAQVEEIRMSSDNYKVLAERMGIHYQTVYRIRKHLRRKTYG